MQQRNLAAFVLVSASVIFGLSMPVQSIKSAPIEYPISIFCLPENAKVDMVGAFVQSRGEALTVHCDVSSSDKEKEFTAFLLGKQIFEGRNLAATGSAVMLKGNETADVTLVFPAVFQGGEYQYTFSLQENGSGQSLAHEAYLLGSIESGKTNTKIISATLDRDQYVWQDSFRLTVNFDWPKSEKSEDHLSLRVSLDDDAGKECAVLVEKQTVASSTETVVVAAAFPTEGACANQLTLSLLGSDNNVVDQKILAVGLPAKQPIVEQRTGDYLQVFGKVSRPILAFLVLTGILVLGLGGSILMRRKVS